MKKQKSLKVNFFMNALLMMSSIIFPLITFPYVSRILGPGGIGKVSFATSLITYFNIFAQLGIPTYGIKECAKVRDDREKLTKTVQEIFIINLFTMVISYIFLFIAVLSIPKLQNEKILYLIIGPTIFLNTLGMEWLYKGLEEYTYITSRSLIFKLISLLSLFILVREKNDYILYSITTVLASSASYIMNFIHLRKYIDLRPVKIYDFRRHIKPIIILFAMSCATTIYTNLDTVMLGFIKSDLDVGYYNAAVKVKGILVNVVCSLGTVLLPRCSYYIELGMIEEFKRICKKALNFVFVLALPLMVYFMLFSKPAIFFLSGTQFSESILPMIIIMPTLLFIGLTNILGMQILLPLGKEKELLKSVVAGAIVDLIINLLLISKLASIGAAIGTVVAEFTVLIFQAYYLKEYIVELFKGISYMPIIMGVILSSICSSVVYFFDLNVFLILVASAFIFFGVYAIILLLFKEEMLMDVLIIAIRKIRRVEK